VRIDRIEFADGLGAYYNDDQAAIRAGARRDGFPYVGDPVTPGFTRVRQPASCLSVMLVLDDGVVAYGDAVTVQYAGAGGREPVLDAAAAREAFGQTIRDALLGAEVDSFRATAARLDAIEALPTAVAYGVSQALIGAAAHATRRTIAELVAEEYETGVGEIAPVPLFAQTGEDRRAGVDRMVLKRVDELPHGLINNADALVGRPDGDKFREYVTWVRGRVLELRDTDEYEPVLHFDVYGTIGDVFPDIDECARYLASLGEAAAPLTLRIEQPVHARSREEQIEVLRDLRARLTGTGVQVVADEWCNTLDDVREFVKAKAADMVQVKTPDLGNVDKAIRALVACKEGGALAYCGGSCTDTERAAQVFAGVAMGVGADLLLARPGMGVDEAVMVTRNEMARTAALAASR
jgi:methylaspartate ammonia-lyase